MIGGDLHQRGDGDVPRQRRVSNERKTKFDKMGSLQHPLFIVLVFPWLVFDTVLLMS